MENLNTTDLTRLIIMSTIADIMGLIGAFSLILIIPRSTIIMIIIIAFLLNHLRNSYTLLFAQKKIGNNNNRLSEILDNNVLLADD